MKKLSIILAGTISLVYAANSHEFTSSGLVNVVAKFEDFQPKAYYGRGEDFQTIGYGHRIMPQEVAQLSKKTLSLHEATQLLAHDLRTRANIDPYLKVEISRNEYEAMRSLCFNIGQGKFAKADLLKTVSAEGTGSTNAYEYFGHWRKSSGEISRGLIKRRFAELFIFSDRTLDPNDDASPSDQWGLDEMSITDANWGKIDYSLRKEAVSLYQMYSME